MRTEQETLTWFGDQTTDCHTKRQHASQQGMVSRRPVGTEQKLLEKSFLLMQFTKNGD